jgi:cell division protein ZapA
VQIKILNQTFNIQGVDDEEYLRKLATHVEERMAELQRATNTIDSNRLALLAALHIADDYFQLQNQLQQLDRFVSRKSAEFVKVLDQFTQEPPS